MRRLSLLLLLILAGCVNLGQGTSPSRHYLVPSLADSVAKAPVAADAAPGLSLAPVTLPGYLDRPQLVRREGDRIEPAPFDRWAEPLAGQVERVVRENLEHLEPRFRLVRDGDYRLRLDLQRLDAEDLQVRLQLRWTLENRKGDSLAGGRFNANETLVDDSAASLVSGYGKLLERFSRDLVQRLERLEL